MKRFLLLSNNQEFKKSFKQLFAAHKDAAALTIYFSPFDILDYCIMHAIDAVFIDHAFPDIDGKAPEAFLSLQEPIRQNQVPCIVVFEQQQDPVRSKTAEYATSLPELKKLIAPVSLWSKIFVPGDRLILAIDNDEEFLRPLAFRLKKMYGYHVLTATDGKLGLSLANQKKPALILLDISMPEFDGFETCSRLKDDPATNGIPVIFLTSRGQTSDIEKGLAVGAADYIVKPYNPRLLMDKIGKILHLDSSVQGDRTILLIDDDHDFRKTLSIRLQRSGYQVISAGSGEEGLQKALTADPDLIICDVMMPDMSGHDVVRRLKAIKPGVPFLFLSAKSRIPDIDQGLQLGADDYVTKPYNPEVLLKKVAKLLGSEAV